MLKKIVVSPDNKVAVSFFEEIGKRKDDIRKKIEEKASNRTIINSKKK